MLFSPAAYQDLNSSNSLNFKKIIVNKKSKVVICDQFILKRKCRKVYAVDSFAPARMLKRGEFVSALGLAPEGDVTGTLTAPEFILIMLARAAPGDMTVLNCAAGLVLTGSEM